MVIFVAALEASLRFGEVSFAAGESDADLDFFFDVGVFGFGFAFSARALFPHQVVYSFR